MDELEKINPFHILAQRLTRIEQMLVRLMENTDLSPDPTKAQQPELLSISEAARFLGLSKPMKIKTLDSGSIVGCFRTPSRTVVEPLFRRLTENC